MSDELINRSTTETTDIAAKIDHFVLGQTIQGIDVDTSKDLSLVVQHMVSQARHSIKIFTRNLDAPLYDKKEFIDILKKLARSNGNSMVQILVQDSSHAVKHGHRLIQLSQDLSSYIKIRKVHNDYKNYNHAFLIADTDGVIFRELADRYEALVDYRAPIRVKELSDLFTSIWETSEPDSQLRRLHI